MTPARVIVCLVIGYLFGCFQTGYLYGRVVKKDDIRKHGSGNVGTANIIRTYGKKAGYLFYALDTFKVILAIIIVRIVIYGGEPNNALLGMITGLGAVCGHNWPFYLHFKGGKGIAATSGVMMTLGVWIIIIELLAFFVPYYFTRIVSVGSLVLTGVFPFLILIFYPGQTVMFLIALILAVMAWIQHRTNIVRLLNGTESSFRKK